MCSAVSHGYRAVSYTHLDVYKRQDKALLKSYVEQLNAEYDGLNLSYSEEGDYLNLNTEQMLSLIHI